ncbi:MAG: hypothetical protein ACRD0W_01090 [Acidimicrobiales bacterium]
MAEWMYLQLGDGEPVRVSAESDVVGVFEARGFVKVDDPDQAFPAVAVEPDEIDARGQGWVFLEHPETGGTARVPVEVVDAERKKGWESVAALAAAEAKKRARKQKSEPAGDDTEEKVNA